MFKPFGKAERQTLRNKVLSTYNIKSVQKYLDCPERSISKSMQISLTLILHPVNSNAFPCCWKCGAILLKKITNQKTLISEESDQHQLERNAPFGKSP